MPTRKAHATWEKGLRDGKGSFRGESGAIAAPYSFGSRFENAAGSNPEELLAAAEAACFSMALSLGLEQAGTPGTRVDTDATCTIDKTADGFRITGIHLEVVGTVPGIDAAAFQKAAADAKSGCPVSRALTGVDITMNARLA